MAILRISLQLKKLIEKYCCVKDTEGMSPAKVYKLVGVNKNLYLKIKGSDYPWWIEGGLEHFAMWAGKVPGKSYGNVSLVNFIKVFLKGEK